MMLSKLMPRGAWVMVLVCLACGLGAQTTIVLGDTTVSSNTYPFNQNSFRFQLAFSAAEFNRPAGTLITSIEVHGSVVAPPTFNNFQLRLAHTSLAVNGLQTTFANNFGTLPGPLTVCLQAATYQPTTSPGATATLNWYKFTLTTPFQYNGTDNLLIDYSFDSKVGGGWNVATVAVPPRNRIYAANPGVGAANALSGGSDLNGNLGHRFTVLDGPTVNTSTVNLNLGSTVFGTASTPVQYNVNGDQLTAATTITAPAGVEISFAQASGFAPTLQISQFPTFGPTTVYARTTSNAPVGPITGNIAHESPGATIRNVAVTGNIVSLVASVATLNAGFTTIGVPGNPVSYDLTGDGLVAATTVTVPAGFEVASSAAGPFGPVLNIPTSPSYVQTVYVRLFSPVANNFAGDVVNTSAPATINIPITGDVFPPDNLHAQRVGPSTTLLVDNNSQGGDTGLLLLHFTLNTITQPWNVVDLTFTASGTADEQAGLSFLGLYEDSATGGTGGVFDGSFIDTIATAGPGVNFNGPNGTYQAVLANPICPALTTRRFFLVCRLAGKAISGETVKAELTNINATSPGTGIITGTPTNHPADAFMINDAELTLYLNGPVVFQTVNNDAQGVGNDGLVICNIRILPKNDAWTVNSLTFSQTGTMDGQADVSFLGLYVDDGDGVWDGPSNDLLATSTPSTNFNGPSGIFTAGLTAAAGTFTVNQTKRFFLVAKLSGSAGTGETLKVRVTAMNQNAPTGGVVVGVPTGSSSALIIDQPTLTVNAGPSNPTTVTREKSAAGFSEMIGQVRLSARNSAFTVSGMTLHTSGNGDWLNHLDPATGVQVFRDNGNGSFDAGDISLFSGPGATPSVACNFTTNQNIAMNTDLDLWVVLNLLPSAGGSPYEVFRAAIETAADINSLTAGGTVKIGTLAPTSGDLRVVDFRVDDFTPTVGLFAGGAAIKIEGSGFALPVALTIGGVPCTGTAVVDAGGTLISGLSVPSGTGTNLAIVLTTNNLPPKTLTQTFRYSNILPNPNVGGTTTPASDSCAAIPGAPLGVLALPALALVGLRRRRK